MVKKSLQNTEVWDLPVFLTLHGFHLLQTGWVAEDCGFLENYSGEKVKQQDSEDLSKTPCCTPKSKHCPLDAHSPTSCSSPVPHAFDGSCSQRHCHFSAYCPWGADMAAGCWTAQLIFKTYLLWLHAITLFLQVPFSEGLLGQWKKSHKLLFITEKKKCVCLGIQHLQRAICDCSILRLNRAT